MTTVYGVTFIGAKRMLEKQLREHALVPKPMLFSASLYLATKVILFD